MLTVIPTLIDRDAARALAEKLRVAEWVDGNVTSGEGAALAKRNRQLAEDSIVAVEARRMVQSALAASSLFLSASLPARIFPPLFNRYGVGDSFGAHVDNAIRVDTASGTQMRTDLSATLFLCDPDDYDGGSLTIEGAFGAIDYKLNAGDLLLYPASSLHRVNEITLGERFASFFWVESLVRDSAAREMLFELDQSVQCLTADRGADDEEVLRLTRLYHNLMRRWGR